MASSNDHCPMPEVVLDIEYPLHQPQIRSPGKYYDELGGQQVKLPSEHKIVDVQRPGTTLVAEHNNLPEDEPPQNINKTMIIIKPSIHQYSFDAFLNFVNANIHLVVADEQM